jgi:DNA-binding NarL/FixJ family response regulator
MVFHISLKQAKDGWVVAECPTLPGCVSQGRDKKEALENVKEAIAAWMRYASYQAVWLAPQKTALVVAGNLFDALTEREKLILGLMAAGCTNRVIAATLHVRVGVIDYHAAHIQRKTHMRHRAQLVRAYVSGSAPVSNADIPGLSPRQNEIARLRVAGMSLQQIAERLSISTRTVDAHLLTVYRRLGVTSVTELGAYYGRLDRERGAR